jgi:signal transduction histidine kinase
MVSVPGACTSEVNARGQLTGITLHTPSLELIRILDPVPVDPFAVQALPIATVSTFDSKPSPSHRIKVSGIVTLIQLHNGFYIQDDTGGMRISTQETKSLNIGDRVEALGFAAIGDFSPYLDEASFRRIGIGVVPVAKKTTAEEILLHGKSDGQRVELEAQLVQDIPRSSRPKLVLQDGAILFRAHIEGLSQDPTMHRMESGSILSLKGVCVVQGGESHEPEAFRLLLANSLDVQLLSAPTWWTIRHGLMVAGSLALVAIASLAWVLALRSRVRSQTEVIRQKMEERKEIEAALCEISAQERRRLGHELHDGLGQYLTGIALKAKLLEENLAAAHSPEVEHTKQIVALINSATHQTRALAHGLDPVHVEAGGLVPALANLAAQTGDLFHLDCEFSCLQDRLDPELEICHALYRITQEAIRNAAIHGQSHHVKVRLAQQDSHLCLSVRDDGKGFLFDTKRREGLGLHIMRYRAGSVGGNLSIESTPGNGTVVTCCVPLIMGTMLAKNKN